MSKKKSGKETTANVALPVSVHQKLKAEARAKHQPISYLATLAVMEFLEGTREVRA